MVNPEDEFVVGVAEKIYGKSYNGMPPGWRLRLKTALIVDAVDLFYETVLDLTVSEQVVIKGYPLKCNGTTNWRSGHTIVNYMKGVLLEVRRS